MKSSRRAGGGSWAIWNALLTAAIGLLPDSVFGLAIPSGTNTLFFNQVINISVGDISPFFETGTTNLRPGVCVGNDAAPALPGIPGSQGLGESPSSGGGTRDAELHPSGFNQRRVITAFNPAVAGGTLYIGVDLPGGTGSPSNPTFSNDFGGVVARGQVLPFDADGNGEADFIGRTVEGDPNSRYSACPAPMGLPDVWTCLNESAGGVDNPRLGAVGEQEFYNLTVVFGGGQRVTAVFAELNGMPANQAGITFSTQLIPPNTAGVRVSTDTGTTGVPQGFDVLFAVTNLNVAITNECQRWDQTVSVRSGSNSDGSGQGEDVNAVRCVYLPPAFVDITVACPPNGTLAGGTLTLSVTVSNAGPVTLTNVLVTNMVAGVQTNSVPAFSLAPGVTTTFPVSYLVPADYASCFITNILSVVGNNFCTGAPVFDRTTNVCSVAPTPAITVTKFCPPTNAVPGTEIVVTGAVCNVGMVDLMTVVVSNFVSGVTSQLVLPPFSLGIGQCVSYTNRYLVPANYTNCFLPDTVIAWGTSICGSNVMASVTRNCLVEPPPALAVTKYCPPTNAVPGTTLVVTGVVANVGAIGLVNVVASNFVSGITNQRVLGPVNLAPGQAIIYTNSYLIPADYTNCLVPDTVVAWGTSSCGTPIMASASTNCSLEVIPQLTVTKFCPLTNAVPGTTLVVTGAVANTGPVTVVNVVVSNVVSGIITQLVAQGVSLAPGQRLIYTNSYLVPVSYTNCFVPDTVVAWGTSSCGTLVSASASTNCSVEPIPALVVTKYCPPTNAVPGTTLVVTGSVANVGFVGVINVVVSNLVPGITTQLVAQAVGLAPGQRLIYTNSYLIPENYTNCFVPDTVVAWGISSCGTLVTASASTNCSVEPQPALVITKYCPPTNAVPGTTLVVTGSVANVGLVGVVNIVVSNVVPGITTQLVTQVAGLAPGQRLIYTNSYLVPIDFTNCMVPDTVVAWGISSCGTLVTASASTNCSLEVPPQLTVTKYCPPTNAVPGTSLVVTGAVANTGPVTVVNIVVSNVVSGIVTQLVAQGVSLAPGQRFLYTNSYLVPANYTNCFVPDTVVAWGTSSCGTLVTASASTNCSVEPQPALVITKYCPPTNAVPGTTLVVTGSVANVGLIGVVNIVVSNVVPGITTQLVTQVAGLAPGQRLIYTNSYLVPINFTNCMVPDTVVAWGISSCGTLVTASASTNCSLEVPPQLTVTKYCPPTNAVPGTSLVVTGAVANTGPVTVVNIVVSNVVSGIVTQLIAQGVSLAPGQRLIYTNSYLVPANYTNCFVPDTVVAWGISSCGTLVTASASTNCSVEPQPALVITKYCPPTNAVPGTTLVVTGSVANVGLVGVVNIVVSNVVPGITTQLVTQVAGLAPGQRLIYTNSYLVPIDFTNCMVPDTVVAWGISSCGTLVTASASTNCSLEVPPQLTVTKYCPPTNAVPGTSLVVTGAVANTGPVTVVNIVVSNVVSGIVTQLIAQGVSLAPGQRLIYTNSYLVPANYTNCFVPDTVVAWGTSSCGTFVTASASTNCSVEPHPALVVTKYCPPTNAVPGTTLVVTGSVANVGLVGVVNIVVSNVVPGITTQLVTQVAGLAPGQRLIYTNSYLVPENYTNCFVPDTVVAWGISSCGTVVSASASTNCMVEVQPALLITKYCPPTNAAPGTDMVVTGAVMNVGFIAVVDIVVSNFVTGVTNQLVLGPVSLAPGQQIIYTNTYRVPPGSTNCFISDLVVAWGRSACDTPVMASASATCPVTPPPGILVTQFGPLTNTPPGGTVMVTGLVCNVGQVALMNVVVSNYVTGVTSQLSLGPIVLNTNECRGFTNKFVVPANYTNCFLTSRMVATGTSLCGSNVTSSATNNIATAPPPQLLITRNCSPTNAPPGGTVELTGAVCNVGQVALMNVFISNFVSGVTTQLVLGPVTLNINECVLYTNRFTVPLSSTNCSIRSYATASAVSICGSNVTASVTNDCGLALQPRLVVMQSCPLTNTPAGTALVVTGVVCNTGQAPLLNVVASNFVNALPGQVVFGPISLGVNQCIGFTNVIQVPANYTNCTVRTRLTVQGISLCGSNTVVSITNDCPVIPTPRLLITQECPPTNAAPGTVVRLTGMVCNSGQVTLVNVVVSNFVAGISQGQLLGPLTLGPGQCLSYTNPVAVPGGYTDCFIQSLVTASGTSLCGPTATATNLQTCVLTNPITVALICTTNPAVPGQPTSALPAVPSISDQLAASNRICAIFANNEPISFARVDLSNVPPGYCVTNGTYLSWCVDYLGLLAPAVIYKPLLYLSTGTLPAHLQSPNWDKVNYIINHKQGNGVDVQIAIWHFIGGPVPPWDPVYGVVTPLAQAMINDANANGTGFVPSGNQVTAVILDISPNGQINIIEVVCPSGCVFCLGTTGFVCAMVNGGGPFTYQWTKDGAPLVGQTNSCVQLTNVTLMDAGVYCVDVSSPCGSDGACLPVSVVICPTAPFMAGFAPMGGGAFMIEVAGDLGRTFTVESSGDLITWRRLTTVVNSSGVIQFHDPHATDKCFYRLIRED